MSIDRISSKPPGRRDRKLGAARSGAAASGTAARRRHRLGRGYARGERTRQRIIESAIEMFGAAGYERTSTRAIARRARVSLPALQYYFGGKPGLHRACIEYIVSDVRAQLAPAFEHARAALAAPRLSRAELLRLLRTVVDPFLDAMTRDRPDSWVMFFERALHEQSASFELIREHVAGRLIGYCSQIIARVLGRTAHEPDVLIRALSVVGQMAMVRRARPILLHALKWPDFSGSRLELMKSVLWQQIEAGLAAAAARPENTRRARTDEPDQKG